MNTSTLSIFVLGMVGALAPEIVRLYEIRNDPSRFTWSWFYLIMSLLFASLGGLIAVTLPAVNARGALYAGISTPVLVNTVLKKALVRRKPKLKLDLAKPEPPLPPFDSFLVGL